MHTMTTIRALLFLILALVSSGAWAQNSFTNTPGRYLFTPLTGWTVKTKGTESYVYAPADGDMDSWDEKVEFTVTDGEGIELDDAFEFYTQTDFPSVYGKFKLISQGNEQINGLDARWATFTFSAQGVAAGGAESENQTLSAELQALFYVIKHDNALYLVNGVTEKNLFAQFEPSFRSIIRTFRILK